VIILNCSASLHNLIVVVIFIAIMQCLFLMERVIGNASNIGLSKAMLLGIFDSTWWTKHHSGCRGAYQ
jgi:hypothetical protein